MSSSTLAIAAIVILYLAAGAGAAWLANQHRE